MSWQYALLFPCWVRPISSPATIIGQPWESRRVAMKLSCWRSRTSFTSASSVAPSTPQFQERLSSVPSRFSSPLAWLRLCS